MADDNNNNGQQRQKGGNQQGPKMGITLGTAVSAVNNPNLGETIRGAVADGLGFTAGAIATGVFSFFINKLIKKFKPAASTPALFPTPEDRAAQGPNARELMGQLHQLRGTNRDEAARIVESVGKALGMAIGQQVASTPAVEEPKPAPVQEPKPEPTPTPAPAPVEPANKQSGKQSGKKQGDAPKAN